MYRLGVLVGDSSKLICLNASGVIYLWDVVSVKMLDVVNRDKSFLKWNDDMERMPIIFEDNSFPKIANDVVCLGTGQVVSVHDGGRVCVWE